MDKLRILTEEIFDKNNKINKYIISFLLSLFLIMAVATSIFILVLVVYSLSTVIGVGKILISYLLGIFSCIIMLSILIYKKLTVEEITSLVEKFGVYL